jgi:hypothetical protein
MTYSYWWRPQPVQMSLVRRSKLTGIGHHYGVHLQYSPTWQEVLDLQSDVGLRVVSPEVFAQGRLLAHELKLRGFAQTSAAWARVRELVANPPGYDLLQRNCEHVARRVMLGEAKSPQVSGLLLVAGAVVLAALMGKAG